MPHLAARAAYLKQTIDELIRHRRNLGSRGMRFPLIKEAVVLRKNGERWT